MRTARDIFGLYMLGSDYVSRVERAFCEQAGECTFLDPSLTAKRARSARLIHKKWFSSAE
jgi:hypothetical protein